MGIWKTLHHPLGDLAQLAPNHASGDPSWEAYTLSISQPGRPHLLEVGYPGDLPQTIGLSIMEPNAAGRRWCPSAWIPASR